MRTKSPAIAVLLAAAPIALVLVLTFTPIGTNMVLAGVPAFFGVSGIGHLYLRDYKRAAILVATSMTLASLMLYAFEQIVLTNITLITAGVDAAWNPQLLFVLFVFIAEGALYIGIFIWQIFDVRKLAKKFNYEVTKTRGAQKGKEI